MLETKSWEINSKGQGDIFHTPRKNHGAVRINKFMLIFGGMDDCDKQLNDMWSYNFESNIWQTINLQSGMPSLSHHGMTAVFANPKKIEHLYERGKGTPRTDKRGV